MRSRSTILFVLLAFFALPALAQAPPPGPPPGGPGGHHPSIEFAISALDLTSDQSKAIDALLAARHATADAARSANETAHRALADAVRATTFDEATIRAAAATVASLDADRIVADAALLRDVRALLTTEQKAKLEKLMTPPAPPSGRGRGN